MHQGRMVGGEELCNPWEMGSEMGGRLQNVISYRSGGEIGDLNWRRGEDLLLSYLLLWSVWLLATNNE